MHCVRVTGDCGEVGAGGLIGFGAALFPVAESAEGDLVAGGEFFLGEAEGAAEGFGAGDAGHRGHVGFGEGLGVGVGVGGGFDLGFGHGAGGARGCCGGSIGFAHGGWPFGRR